jgi:hypothetical protein
VSLTRQGTLPFRRRSFSASSVGRARDMGLFVIMFEKTRESRLGLALFSFPVGWCAFGLVSPEAPRHAKKSDDVRFLGMS